MINGLESGKIGAADLDALWKMRTACSTLTIWAMRCRTANLPMLRSFPNVIFTPHTAFYTDVNVASMVESAFKAVRAMADGEQRAHWRCAIL